MKLIYNIPDEYFDKNNCLDVRVLEEDDKGIPKFIFINSKGKVESFKPEVVK